MDREEKLKAAKEKLAKFKKKKQDPVTEIPQPSKVPETQEVPVTQPDPPQETNHEVSQESSIPLFTMFSEQQPGEQGHADFPVQDQFSAPETDPLPPMFDTKKGVFEDYTNREAVKAAGENVIGVVNFGYNPSNPEITPENFSESLVMNLQPVVQPASDDGQEETAEEKTHKKHECLSEQIAGILSAPTAAQCEDEEDEAKFLESNEILRQKFDEFEKEKQEMQQQIQQQASSIVHFQAYLKAQSAKLEAAEQLLVEERERSESKLEEEREKLKDQMKSYTESIQILVMEKTDLEGLLTKTQNAFTQKDDEINKLNEENRMLQEEMSSKTLNRRESDSVDKTVIEALKNECQTLNDQVTNMRQEMSELYSKYEAKEEEVAGLKKHMAEVQGKYELSELNLSQLRKVTDNQEQKSDGDSGNEDEIKRLVKENEEHVKRVEELSDYIQKAAQDREQIIHQYTSYSQQLTSQIESLTKDLNEKKVSNHNLACREADLVSHVQRLEEQMQKLMQTSKNNKIDVVEDKESVDKMRESLNIHVERVRELEMSLKEIGKENETLKGEKKKEELKVAELTQKVMEMQEELSDMETKLEMERMNGGSDVRVTQEDLVAALQSDKVAASRAMTQNKDLKQQLEELELAVIQTTNSKANIASELETLRRKEANWNEKEKQTTSELQGLKQAVAERDRSINQLREQIKYYINFAENSIHGHLDGKPRNTTLEHEQQIEKLAKELLEAKDEIRGLNSTNSELRDQLEVLATRTRTPTTANDTPTTNGVEVSGNTSPSGESTASSDSSSLSSGSEVKKVVPKIVTNNNNAAVPLLSPEVALLKLEQKFKEAMMKNVELASEKEELEHLVVQLQEETETVGEYITIYQYQRQQQKLRLQEKESQLQALSMEREILKDKLAQLQGLVKNFVGEKSTLPAANVIDNSSSSSTPVVNGKSGIESAAESEDEVLEIAEEADVPNGEVYHRVVLPESDKSGPHQVLISSSGKEMEEAKQKGETADRILALISEIGSNQILTDDGDFHPWFWEHPQGKLMTV